VVAGEVYGTTRAEKMFCTRVKYLLFSSSCKMYYFVFISKKKIGTMFLEIFNSDIFAILMSFSESEFSDRGAAEA
jgi:hypothetical protein